MVFPRKLYRKPVIGVLFIIIVLLLVMFHKHTNLTSLAPDPDPNASVPGFSEELNADNNNTDDPSLDEVRRLEQEALRVRNKEPGGGISIEDMLRKYNESLRHKAEEEDPFVQRKTADYFDFINFQPTFADTQYTAKQLQPVIADLNKRRLTYNKDKFKELPEDHPVVVIQVHKRIVYFKELLDSLQRAKGIENILLVISHDFYLDSLNALVRQITFCRVIQIFFPYSLQLYPDEFPGQSSNDCPRDMKKKEALVKGCQNAQHPDQYGHYREARVTIIKHHWWWKINMVFDELLAEKKHNGPVLFIEEDHYVSPSFYQDLMKLHQVKHSDPRCTESCEILTLGSYSKKENYETNAVKVLHGVWVSTQHNMGMAMYKSTWQKLKICATSFCTYDDYNWDWTLMHLSKTCIGKVLSVLVYELPRIFHIGDCGLHHTKSCNSKDTQNKVKRIINTKQQFMFPDKLVVTDDHVKHSQQKPNGGWGDVRDHELCLNFVKPDQKLMR
jgi:alpha-1,6-mannosyl-glycoprotein beta-1,2-N-acetylglucosaminyltransferase